MIDNNIFKHVKELAKATFTDPGNEILSLIYGYAKLVSMDKSVLDVLFESEEERSELVNISKIIDDYGLDIDLIKQGAPFFNSYRTDNSEKKRLREILNAFTDKYTQGTASQLLCLLLESKMPEFETLRHGGTIEGILEYIECKIDDISDEKYSRNSIESKEISKTNSTIEEETRDNKIIDDHSNIESDNNISFYDLVRKTSQLYDGLKCKIYGQDEAIRAFSEGFFQSEVFREENRKGPSACFLFAGPPGVGKTYLATAASTLLNLPFLRIDMSEYGQRDSVHRLSGVPKTFASPRVGVLTDFVQKNPKSIVLFDEIEKASEEVIYQFLQILDGGTLTDEYLNKSISFRDTILIFTTNVGKKLYEDKDRENLATVPRPIIIKEIQNEKNEFGNPIFPAAICSRFASGNIVMFNHLGVNSLLDIINGRFKECASIIKETYGYDVEFDDKLAALPIYANSNKIDARFISSQSTLMIKNEIYEFGRHILGKKELFSKINSIKFSILLDKDADRIKKFFEQNESINLLYIGENSDIYNIPFGNDIRIIQSNGSDYLEIISNHKISIVLIDMDFGNYDNSDQYLSLDDIKSLAVRAFDEISEKVFQLPIYLIHKKDISEEDKLNFIERGARDFIKWNNDYELADRILRVSNAIYIQEQLTDLSSNGRVLKYNTAQKIVGESAEIVFYDFKEVLAYDSEDSKLLLSDRERPKDKFDDIIGADNAKEELKYFVEYLKNPQKYMAQSIKVPKGILLYGPPGTGKTMLARAMAGESDVTFFPTTATDFLDKYYGESEKKIKRIFSTARKFAPSIIFIDEIDAIGKKRTGGENSHHTESMLNALLTEMDGFELNASKPVFVIAATNYSISGQGSVRQGLDSALLRRFDNKIYVDLPNENERKKYIKILLKEVDNDVSDRMVNNVAKRTMGESLAIIRNIVELSVRNSIRNNTKLIDAIFLDSFEEYMYGEKKEWSEEYYKQVSIHEAGHAYVCFLSGEIPSFVTIVSRGQFGGYMQHSNNENVPSYTKEQLIWKIRIALAGRIAEIEFFGEQGVNTGASSDYSNATQLALNLVYKYVMTDNCNLNLENCNISDINDRYIKYEYIERIIAEEYEKTVRLVHDGRKKINKLAKYLQKNNNATETDIKSIFE